MFATSVQPPQPASQQISKPAREPPKPASHVWLCVLLLEVNWLGHVMVKPHQIPTVLCFVGFRLCLVTTCRVVPASCVPRECSLLRSHTLCLLADCLLGWLARWLGWVAGLLA